MAGIKVKKAGVYVDPVAIFVKKGGVYAAVAGLFVKAGGAYLPVGSQNPLPAPTVMRTIETIPASGDNTQIYARVVYAEIGRDLIIRNPITNTATIALGFRDADNIVNPNADFSAQILLNPGQEMFSDNDVCQYWVRQNSATAVPDQFIEVEKVITL